MLKIVFSNMIKRDYKKASKRGKDMEKLSVTLKLLANRQKLPRNYRDHQLAGNFEEYRECHVGGEGDWFLLYQVIEDKLILFATGTGTHVDLF
ncbi:MAG: type II toxin-antitoxin system YafQ family toxin [Clostridiales bacterium]|jgi:mRNA interferase YafQ|nr:type II toxin-antitoxin system YafQ family toxin [Clostridiales bacterium]